MPERTTPAVPGDRIPRLTMPELWAALAVLLPVLGSLIASLSTVDLAYHVRAGQLILDTGTLPSPDTFTFTAAGLPWLDQQWGAQVLFAGVFRIGGWALLAVLRASLVGLIAWLVFRACRSSGAGTRVAAWLTLAGFGVGLVALGLRPQLLGMVLFAATIAVLAARDRRPSLVWAIPLLVVVWANVHGSFFLGPAAVVVAWLEDEVTARPGARRLLGVALVCLAATFIGPYLGGVWVYATGLAVNPTIRSLISEWQATTPLSFVGVVFYGSILGAAAIVAIAVRRGSDDPGSVGRFVRTTWPTLAWLIGLALVGAYAERGVAWWSIAAPVAVARLVHVALARLPSSEPTQDAGGRATERRSLLTTSIVAVLVVVAVAILPIWRGGDPRYGPTGLLTEAPRSITEAVASVARLEDRIWNAQRWGSWLEFAVPGSPVAVDSRIELIPADAWADHVRLSGGAAGWADILDRHGVTIVVASSTEQRGLIPRMRASPGWRVLSDGEDGVVFVRSDRP